MKKFKLIFVFLLLLLNYTPVDAVIINGGPGGGKGQYMGVQQIEIRNNRTKYYIRGSYVNRPTLAQKQNFIFEKTNASHYNYKIEEWIQIYANNTYYNGIMNDDNVYVGKSVLIAPELYTSRVFNSGGTSGSCRLIDGEINCNYRDKPSEWTYSQQTNPIYLAEAYPEQLDNLVYISRSDEDSPVKFGKNQSFPNKIIENGNLDSEGRYIAITPLKVYQSEYDNGTVEVKVSSEGEHNKSNLFFSHDGNTYTEKYGPEAIYDNYISSDGKTSKSWSGKYKYYIPIDTSKNVIHGLYFLESMQLYANDELYKEASPAVSNIVNYKDLAGTSGVSIIYEFEIPIEVVPDENKQNAEEKNNILTGMQENNARIFIDDKEIKILNKKNYDLGRIYVSLQDICDNLNNCKIEQENDKENKVFYRITRSILDTNIDFSLIHYPETKIFETSIYKNNENLGYDIISPATGSIDAASVTIDNVLYVPIRFLLQGLGANITYVASKDKNSPEEVHISFNDTKNIALDSDSLKKTDSDKYQTNRSINNFKIVIDNNSDIIYPFQIGTNNAIIKSLNDSDNYSVEFPSPNVYNYLFIIKTKHNDSEMLMYKKIDIEYKK